jgi:thiol-disulfide isomerase/thioredoxin
MEQHSASLLDIGSNGKPTVIDFWAPWCINCRVFAPTLYAIEHEYQDRINFIVVNGDDAKNYPLVQLLGVDAIPHVALLDSEGDVETALIGPISRRVMRADLDALLHQRQIRVASGANGVDCSSGGGSSDRVHGGKVGGEKAASAASSSTVAEVTPSQEPALSATTSTTIVCHDDLPYKMYDAFGYRPEESRRIHFR